MLEITREKSTYVIDVGCHWALFFFLAVGADPQITPLVVGMSMHDDHGMV